MMKVKPVKGAMKLLAFMSALLAFLTPALCADQSAVVLLYHRFGENEYPTTNIRLEQFDAQIEELKTGGYTVMKLSDIVAKLKARETLPDRTVAITVDDAYKSVFLEAWPRLKAAGFPLTLFVSTEPLDTPGSNYMTWDDVRAMVAEGVEIGHHTASHLHMYEAGVDAGVADINAASARFKAELGMVPSLFAYPYGEYSPALRDAVVAAGFNAAFGQFSGPAAPWNDLFILPRFPVNEHYGDLSRFSLISQTKALPVADLAPFDPILTNDHNPPLFGFSVDDTVTGLQNLNCYPSHLGSPAEIVRPDGNRIEVRFTKPFPKGRNRINCTLPAGAGRWYWLGQYFYVPGGTLD